MKSIQTKILTPYGPVFDGQAEGVNLPGSEGAFEVKYNHANIMAMLDIGKVLIRTNDGNKVYSVSGGFVEVFKNQLTILAESAESTDKIDVERARRAKEAAEKQIKESKVKDVAAELALKRAINRLNLAG